LTNAPFELRDALFEATEFLPTFGLKEKCPFTGELYPFFYPWYHRNFVPSKFKFNQKRQIP